MSSAIAAGYKRGIATIVDANVVTLLTAFILFVLATAGVKGFAFTLFVGTIVSLLTAVVFTQSLLGSMSRTRLLQLARGPRRLRRTRSAGASTSPPGFPFLDSSPGYRAIIVGGPAVPAREGLARTSRRAGFEEGRRHDRARPAVV